MNKDVIAPKKSTDLSGTPVIIACDFASAEETYRFLDKMGDVKPYVKIGMELYYAEGPAIVRELKRRGHKIFLDLKLHNIPNTVKKAMAVLSRLDVDMCNLHAAGTIEMMKAAVEIGAANLTNPMVAKEIIDRLPALMDELKIEKLTDIIGIVNHE